MTKGAQRVQVALSLSPLEDWMREAKLDFSLMLIAITIICLGLVMVASASVSIAERNYGDSLYFFYRQLAYVSVGLVLAIVVIRVPLVVWEQNGHFLFLFSLVLLALVLIPGIGHVVNGSSRWISLGFANLQVSELGKLCGIFYLSGYLMRHGNQLRSPDFTESILGFVKPLGAIMLAIVLMLMEPDFGASVVLLSVTMGMMFLGGARLSQFAFLLMIAVVGLTLLAVMSPYRLLRITTFLNPWADPFKTGFQLTQALIAIGSGDFFGLGLGNSIQKLFYLPEAHTDFLFSVWAEEFGLAGAIGLIGLFSLLLWKAFAIGACALKAGLGFAGYTAYGIGLWIGMQAFVNMGVNMGLLPTKGLTLPLMSYGGSSMIVICMAIGVLIRADHETRMATGV